MDPIRFRNGQIIIDGRMIIGEHAAKVVFIANAENHYSCIDWRDSDNQTICRMTAHELAHPDQDGNRRIDRHFTIYTADDTGKLIGRLEIPYGHKRGQVHVENGPLVVKDPGEGIVLRSEDGTAFLLTVSDGGTLRTTRLTSDAIIKTQGGGA